MPLPKPILGPGNETGTSNPTACSFVYPCTGGVALNVFEEAKNTAYAFSTVSWVSVPMVIVVSLILCFTWPLPKKVKF